MYAFLFDSGHPSLGTTYGPPCTLRVVRAVEGLTHCPATQLLRGDVTVGGLAYRLKAFRLAGTDATGNRGDDGTLRSTRSYSHRADQELFKVALCDLAETLSAPPSTTDTARLVAVFARSVAWAVVSTSMSLKHARTADAALQGFGPYLGMSAIDLGNPVHRELMHKSMSDVALIANGQLYYEVPIYSDAHDALIFARELGSVRPPIELPYDEYHRRMPRISWSSIPSPRGFLTLERLFGKKQDSHRERFAKALLEKLSESKHGDVEFSTESREGRPAFVTDEKKFVDYLLKLDHPDGGPKAKFFSSVLGIERDDWKFLADQIRRGAESAPIYRANVKAQGFSHGALVMVAGRNGRTAVIETGWHIDAIERTDGAVIAGDGAARFVTAYPANEEVGSDLIPPPLLVIDGKLKRSKRWSAILNLALEFAAHEAAEIIPTPDLTEEGMPNWEGETGIAWLRIEDDRPLAEWLFKIYGAGIQGDDVLLASRYPTRSVERHRAYAKGMSEVFVANGYRCKVESRSDFDAVGHET